MKWITVLIVVISAVAVASAIAALVGSRLPQAHHAFAERVLHVPPDLLWHTLTDIEAFPTWRRDLKRVRRLPDRDGKPIWVEEGVSGKITFVFERTDPPRLVVSRIADRDLAFGGTWTSEITTAPDGSRLKITEDGEIYNPLFRFMARFILGYDNTINKYLSALETKFHGV